MRTEEGSPRCNVGWARANFDTVQSPLHSHCLPGPLLFCKLGWPDGSRLDSENRLLKHKASVLFLFCLLSFTSTTTRLPDDTAESTAAPITQQAEASTSTLPMMSTSTTDPTSALPASDEQQDQAQGDGEAGMLKAEDVAQDPTVFTPEGRIVFHRSDGDPEYKPPNLIVPNPKEVEVNYYHIFSRDEQKWVNWSKAIAQKLATDYFGLEGGNWALKDFPKDYYMTEQRKGPRRTYRTDPYLFGSQAHRFRSTLEFVPHAYWLLCDPNLDPANCRCIYCSKGRRGPAKVATGERVSSKRVSKPVNKFQMTQVVSYRMARNNYKIRAQNSPKGKVLPGVPLAVFSSKERNTELATIESREQGECEGFRVGEIAYCRLREPIVSEEDETHRIIAWPVLIEATKIDVEVGQGTNRSSSAEGQSYSLEGRVKHKRVYDVVFMPTHEKARVDQRQLEPGLMFKMPPSLKKIKLGSREDHPWVQNNTAPELNLENGKQRPPFHQVLFVFLYAVESFHNLRLFYTATDQFSRSEMGRDAVKHVVFAEPNGSSTESAQKEPQAPWLTGSNSGPANNDTAPSVERRIDNGGANRFLQATQQNNYMDLDSDDKSSRRRAPLRASIVNTTAAAAPIAPSPTLDNNTYWQGILLGLERLWVGDLARLRLSKEDVETMMASLAKGNDLFNAEDRVKPDLTSPYLLRIKAIYRIAKAEVEQTDDKIRVAGDVFRVVPIDKATSPEALANGVKQEDGTALFPPKKKTKRPTFEIPFRPFLDKAYEDQLPMSPMLPEGFGYQRVNQASVEVVCSVQQLAGRLWCSFARSGDDQLAKIETKKSYLGHEDSKDSTRIRLSLAAMIPGAVKAMEVHPNEGLFLNRERAIAQACKLALESRLTALDKNAGRDRHSNGGVTEQEGDEAEEEDELDVSEEHPPAKRARFHQQEAATSNGGNVVMPKVEPVESIVQVPPPHSVSSTETPVKAASVTTEASARSNSPPLPENWIKKVSRSNQGTYFANLKTKETSWTRPTA